MTPQDTFYEFIRTLNLSADEHIKLLDLSADWVRAERNRVAEVYNRTLSGQFTDHLPIPTAEEMKQDIANVPAWNGANHLKSKAA